MVDRKNLTDLDKALLRIMNNRKLKRNSKWIYYKNLLHKYFPKRVDHPARVEQPARQPTRPPRRRKSHAIQTDDMPTAEASTSTNIIPNQFYDEIYERQEEPEQETANTPPDYSLEEFIRELAAEESASGDKLVMRPPTNDDYRIFDDRETGSTITVDVKKAREQLYNSVNESPPKKKKISPSETRQLRSRTIIANRNWINV